MYNTSLPPISHHNNSTGLYAAVPYTQCVTSNNQEKIIRHAKRQKTQFEETEQALQTGMTEMLELSDQEFKTTMINM